MSVATALPYPDPIATAAPAWANAATAESAVNAVGGAGAEGVAADEVAAVVRANKAMLECRAAVKGWVLAESLARRFILPTPRAMVRAPMTPTETNRARTPRGTSTH